MARAALKDVVFPDWFKGVCRREGSFYVYHSGTSVEATVYQDATGTTALTQPIAYADYARHRGYVEPADYSLTSGLVSFNASVSGGSASSLSTTTDDGFLDPSICAWSANPYIFRNSVAVSATSGTNRWIRIVPKHKITAAKVVIFSGGTATATITRTEVGIYSTDGTTLTRLTANTTNLTSNLLDSTNTRYAQALNPATVVLYPGVVYYVGVCIVATTAGTTQGFVKTANVVNPTVDVDAPAPMYTLAGQTALDATEAISGLTAAFDNIPIVGILPA